MTTKNDDYTVQFGEEDKDTYVSKSDKLFKVKKREASQGIVFYHQSKPDLIKLNIKLPLHTTYRYYFMA